MGDTEHSSADLLDLDTSRKLSDLRLEISKLPSDISAAIVAALGPKNGGSWPAVRKWLQLAAGGFVLGWVAWATGLLMDIDKQLTGINANRFTSTHGMEVWKTLAEHEARPWHQTMDQRAQAIEDHLERIEASVEKLADE